MGLFGNIFAPAPHIPRLPQEKIRKLYPRYRWRIMESTFLGYAAFYLVRNNLSVVAKDMEAALNYSHNDIGSLLAASAISYGVGKFVMGAVSDRSNPRAFMGFALLATALLNFIFGSVANFQVHLLLWTLNGFIQAMGWPPCGRSMGHWFSERERGLTFSIWNTSHNLGGGITGYLAGWAMHYWGGWEYAFFVPGVLAAIGGVYLLLRLRDTPQSVGLPPIEEYNDDYPSITADPDDLERELGTRELFVDYVLKNKYVWILAFANFFAYVTRYSMLDWGPMYLRDIKEADVIGGGFGVFMLEFGGIPSTILFGWLSDVIGGRRGMVCVLCFIPIIIAFSLLVITPAQFLWLDMILLTAIGFFIYPVINLVVIIALDMTGKKAIGTAAGFIGLFGYLGRTVQAKGFGWMLEYFENLWGLEQAWNLIIGVIIFCSFAAMFLLAFTWKLKPKA
ncbi:MAG: MFS transporter [Candidatus Hydrogenedentales bacterium]